MLGGLLIGGCCTIVLTCALTVTVLLKMRYENALLD